MTQIPEQVWHPGIHIEEIGVLMGELLGSYGVGTCLAETPEDFCTSSAWKFVCTSHTEPKQVVGYDYATLNLLTLRKFTFWLGERSDAEERVLRSYAHTTCIALTHTLLPPNMPGDALSAFLEHFHYFVGLLPRPARGYGWQTLTNMGVAFIPGRPPQLPADWLTKRGRHISYMNQREELRMQRAAVATLPQVRTTHRGGWRGLLPKAHKHKGRGT